jgi:plasmid maintenance system killer protein
VRANWRIIVRFADGKAFDVDLVDYHGRNRQPCR